MLTLYLVSFLFGVGLSVVWVIGGLDHLQVLGHAIHIHHGHGHGHGHHHHGPRRGAVMNAAAITAFLAWFGGAGALLHQMTAWSEAVIAVAAIASGVLGGGSVNRFLQMLSAREKPLEPTTYFGVVARVTSPIREGGTGEIVFVVNSTRKVSAARSDDGTPVDKGSDVVILRMEKGIAYVSTWDELNTELATRVL